MVPQSIEAQKYLNAEIIGESEIVDGKKLIITQIGTETEEPEIAVL